MKIEIPEGTSSVKKVANPSNVIALPLKPRLRAIDNPKLAIKEDNSIGARCFTHSFVFDKNTRKVSCKDCKRAFEPFDALVKIAEQWMLYERDRQHCEQDIKKLHAERDELERVVKNLKSQKRRTHETLAKEGQGR